MTTDRMEIRRPRTGPVIGDESSPARAFIALYFKQAAGQVAKLLARATLQDILDNRMRADGRYSAKLKELRAALDAWIEQTRDMGAIPEKEMIKRGIVSDKLSEYESRKAE